MLFLEDSFPGVGRESGDLKRGTDCISTAGLIAHSAAPEPPWSEGAQRDLARDAATGSRYLEALERISPAQPGQDQDAVRQVYRRAGDGPGLRSSGRVEMWRSRSNDEAVSVCRLVATIRCLLLPITGIPVSTSPSSNRTCRTTASGSRTRLHAFAHVCSRPLALRRTSPKCPYRCESG